MIICNIQSLQVSSEGHFRLLINIFIQHQRPDIHICLVKPITYSTYTIFRKKKKIDTRYMTLIVPSMLLPYRTMFKQLNIIVPISLASWLTSYVYICF